jgi:hypothetical protein
MKTTAIERQTLRTRLAGGALSDELCGCNLTALLDDLDELRECLLHAEQWVPAEALINGVPARERITAALAEPGEEGE